MRGCLRDLTSGGAEEEGRKEEVTMLATMYEIPLWFVVVTIVVALIVGAVVVGVPLVLFLRRKRPKPRGFDVLDRSDRTHKP